MQNRLQKPRISLRKKLAFACLSVCLCFLILEALLTLAGTGTSLDEDDPFVGFESSIPLYVDKPGTDGRVLETASNKLTYFNPQQFEKTKPAGTFRIFCLGGSTTFGRPYDDSTSYCAWLRELLNAAGEGKSFEVINAGGISYASYRIAAVMDELSQYEPDLFIVYCGHNEFLEERTYRDLRESSTSARGLSLLLHRTRTFRAAKQLFSSSTPGHDDRFLLPAEVDAILDHTTGPISYHRDDRLRDNILAHFRLNLARMIRTARGAGAKLVLVTPAANSKDFSPFKSEQLATLSEDQRQQWTTLVAAAAEDEAHGRIPQAIEQLENAISIDPRHAEIRYQLGRLHFGQQQFAEADRQFQAAIDEDICPLRATSGILKIVSQTAAEQRVPLVDYDKLLREDCLRAHGHSSPGYAYFLDHVHPTIGGHRLLATALVEAMIQMQLISPEEFRRDEVHEVAARAIESRIDPALNARALTNLSQVLTWAGKRNEAGVLALEAVNLRAEHQLADDPEGLFYAARHLVTAGNAARATEFFERVLRLRPDIHQARWHLARLLMQEGTFHSAKLELQKLVAAEPDNPRYLQSLGQVLLELEEYDDALNAFEQAGALEPELLGLRDNLKFTLDKLECVGD